MVFNSSCISSSYSNLRHPVGPTAWTWLCPRSTRPWQKIVLGQVGAANTYSQQKIGETISGKCMKARYMICGQPMLDWTCSMQQQVFIFHVAHGQAFASSWSAKERSLKHSVLHCGYSRPFRNSCCAICHPTLEVWPAHCTDHPPLAPEEHQRGLSHPNRWWANP